MSFAAWLLIIITTTFSFCQGKQPNIVLILADDQDQVLGGMDYLPHIRDLLASNGANFTNFFANTPVCCPSRAELIGGRYGHNNLVEVPQGTSCMHANITGPYFLHNQLGVYLSALGYSTGLFGKYMNEPPCTCPSASGCSGAVDDGMDYPPGWSRWFAICDMGGYFNNTWNNQGRKLSTGSNPSEYMTSVIGNYSLEWIRKQMLSDQPFFAYIAPHAPHISDAVFPYVTTPAPWYAGTMGNRTAPRTPNYNVPNTRAHPLIATQSHLDGFSREHTDHLYRVRHESMFSVDDIVRDVVETLDSAGVLNETYIFFTSDHGYALGQMCRPEEKFNVYENDIRVPMLVRGPGVPRGVQISTAVTSIVDLAPTFVDLAGGNASLYADLDGHSLVPWLKDPTSPGGPQMVLIEYWSLGEVRRGAPVSKACNPDEGSDCVEVGCQCHYHTLDGTNNTYLAARLINSTHNYLVAQFYADRTAEGNLPRVFAKEVPVFIEVYDVAADPWQMNNLYPDIEKTQPLLLQEMRAFMYRSNSCRGTSCRS